VGIDTVGIGLTNPGKQRIMLLAIFATTAITLVWRGQIKGILFTDGDAAGSNRY